MPSILDIDLPSLPIASAEFGINPAAFLEAARLKHAWLAKSDLGFVVTGYRAIEDILRLDTQLKMPGEEIVAIMGAEPAGGALRSIRCSSVPANATRGCEAALRPHSRPSM